jgi:hypothetical protein
MTRLKLELIVETESLTPALVAAMCAARELPELICDRCLDPDEIVVTTMEIAAIDETFALCGNCTRELPRGYHVA